MQNRRECIGFLASLALTPTLSFMPVFPAAAGSRDFFIVNGWVLTRADLFALGIDAL